MAAKDAILVTTQGRTFGSQMVNAANQLRSVKTEINNIAGLFAHMTDGTADYVMIEQQLGLATGDGVRLYTLINTLQTQMNGSTAVADFTTKVINAS